VNKFENILSELGLQKAPLKDEKNNTKDLKKILNAYIAVMTHKLGREPTHEEFFKEISSSEEPESVQKSEDQQIESQPTDGTSAKAMIEASKSQNSAMPSVFDIQVYFGKDEDKKPDPRKILYYEHPTGGVYDVSDGRWLFTRPEVLNHIESRPLYHDEQDLMSLILHGLLDHHDYNTLEKAGMIGPNAKKMWDLAQDLQSKWHEIHQHKTDKQDLMDKNNEHKSDANDLFRIIDQLQDRVHELEVDLQNRSSLENDFSEPQELNGNEDWMDLDLENILPKHGQ